MKALLKYKLKSILPALICGGIILIASVVMIFKDFVQINPYLIYYGTFFIERIYTNLFMLPVFLIPIAVCMGIILTKEYGDKNKEDFFSSLPYKKSTRFMVSVLPGLLFFLIFGIVLIIAVLISHSISFDYYSEINMMSSNYELILKLDSVGNAILRVIQIIVSMIMLYFISIFAGVIGRNKMITVLIIVAICVFPIYVPEAINNITSEYFNVQIPFYKELVNYGSLMGLFEAEEIYFETEMYIVMIYPIEKTVTCIIMTVIFMICSYIFAVKTDRMNGKIVVNKKCEAVFIIAMGIYGACFIPMFRGSDKMNVAVLLAGMIAVFAVIVTALTGFVTGKGKYSYLNSRG